MQLVLTIVCQQSDGSQDKQSLRACEIVWSMAFFFAYRGVVLSFILKKSTDYRQIAHDHACQIQLKNQQPRYLAYSISSGNFVDSCKYEFRKYWGSKRKLNNPMISLSWYLHRWPISKCAHDQILLHRNWWDSNAPTKSARALSQLQNLFKFFW